MDLISVIVPVYKVEAFIDECIESIVGQTYKNLEIILVDDGSPDQSGEICDIWAKKDSRIIVVHQKNTGGGQARNIALERAKGDYIAFVDSDDYIAPQMLEYLLSLLNEDESIDIAECNYISFINEKVKLNEAIENDNVHIYTSEQALRENILDKHFRQLIWNKLYRKEVIGNIRFPLGKKIDDEFWTYQVLGNASKLVLSGRKMYAYRQQRDSVMHSMSIEKRVQGIEAKCERHEYIRVKFPELAEESCNSIWNAVIYQGQLALNLAQKQEQKRIFSYLKSVMKKYPMKNLANEKTTYKQKLWFRMSKVSLLVTCKIRNRLGIGM